MNFISGLGNVNGSGNDYCPIPPGWSAPPPPPGGPGAPPPPGRPSCTPPPPHPSDGQSGITHPSPVDTVSLSEHLNN